ncbi:site-2 protease family protein [Peptoniphilus raoultii]|uniref:site-2 protease family protein n=1 Tax=Peptoniphilus raoultii TaxID=1776387 RepID=UPI0008D95383|nr:site-2 protease family protein [Peptoniphilus raoultii]
MANLDIKSLVINIIALLIVIIPHEIAHGYVAYWCGDTTAKEDGRLSLNPLNHIDPIGLLCMVILRFGWAKAVPINPANFTKNRKLSSFLVSIAGVTVNFIMGLVAGILLVPAYYNLWKITPIIESIFWYSIMLGVFNLVPLPPLDGSKVLATFLPAKYEYYFYKYERYFYIVLVILLVTGQVSRYIAPIINVMMQGILQIGIYIWNII